MLRPLTHQALDEIRRVRQVPCLSLFLPNQRRAAGAEQDQELLEELLGEATGLFAARGTTQEETVELLAPIRHLGEDLQGAILPGPGLAIFRAPGVFLGLWLEVCPSPLVEIGCRFVLAPLVASLSPTREHRERALRHYQGARARGRTRDDPAEVLTAAAEGRVEALFLVPGRRRWGTFDVASLQARPHAVREAGDEDLVDLAISLTLAGGGQVYAIPSSSAPGGAPLAAILRS